jgi:hypothetical protein
MYSCDPHHTAKHRNKQHRSSLPAALALSCGLQQLHGLPLVPAAPAAAPAQVIQEKQEIDVSCSSMSSSYWLPGNACFEHGSNKAKACTNSGKSGVLCSLHAI